MPESRARWMKLIGNSVSVPVIDVLIKSIIATGIFDEKVNGNLNLEKKEQKDTVKIKMYREAMQA